MEQIGPIIEWKDVSISTKGSSPNKRREGKTRRRGTSAYQQLDEDQTTITNSLFGIAEPGKVTAIIGPGGAGKTTLLNMLGNKLSDSLEYSGTVTINGSKELPKHVRHFAAFIEEHDVFLGELTVKEHLNFQASLRLVNIATKAERDKVVENTVRLLGLGKCFHTRIGIPGVIKGISGGEKKRLAFASEILTNPAILFADEPIVGLDSYMAENVIKTLTDVAHDKGRTVLITVRDCSSEVFRLFDNVIVMAEGRTIYLGSRKNVVPYFNYLGHECPKVFCPSDYLIRLLTIKMDEDQTGQLMKVNKLADSFLVVENTMPSAMTTSQLDMRYRYLTGHRKAADSCDEGSQWSCGSDGGGGGSGSGEGGSAIGVQLLYKKQNWVTQYRTLFHRCWLTNFRDVGLYRLRLLTHFLEALMFGLIYFQHTIDQRGVMNRSGALFSIITLAWDNSFVMVSSFLKDVRIYRREFTNGQYCTSSYFLARVFASWPHYFISVTLWVLVQYLMEGYKLDWAMYFVTYLTVFSMVIVCAGYGTMVGLMKEGDASFMFNFAPMPMIVFILTGGLNVNLNSLPDYVSWAQYVSWWRYAYEALMITHWTPVTNISCPAPLTPDKCYHTGLQVYESFGFGKTLSPTYDVAALWALALFYYLVGFLCLRYRSYRMVRSRV